MESILSPVEVHIPKDAEIIVSVSPRKVEKAKFCRDYVQGNLCCLPQFFGQNLERRRIGHKLAKAFEGKEAGDTVTLPRSLAFELWNAASQADYSSPHAAQLPESWLYAIPEVEPPPAPKKSDEPPHEKADPNPPLEAGASELPEVPT